MFSRRNLAVLRQYTEVLTPAGLPLNLVRFLWDPRSTEVFVDWEDVVDDVVATLRGEAGRSH
jgi:hypothetical protein